MIWQQMLNAILKFLRSRYSFCLSFGGLFLLEAAEGASLENRLRGVLDVLLGRDTDQERGDVDHLLADSDVTLADQDARLMD